MKALYVGIVVAALASHVETARAAQSGAPEEVTLSFSDPSRVGSVLVQMQIGTLTIRAAERQDVQIEVREAGVRPFREAARGPGPDSASGLRRLTQPAGLVAEESGNIIRLSTGFRGTPSSLVMEVPVRTNIKVQAIGGGPVSIEGVDGDLEVNNMNGSITLTNVSGSVVAHSSNGDVVATVTRVSEGKAMAFTSFNGNIDVSLPSSAKASLHLRSTRGDVYTDFDLQAIASKPVVRDSRQAGGRYRLELARAVEGTVNGGGPDFEFRTLNGNIYLRQGK